MPPLSVQEQINKAIEPKIRYPVQSGKEGEHYQPASFSTLGRPAWYRRPRSSFVIEESL